MKAIEPPVGPSGRRRRRTIRNGTRSAKPKTTLREKVYDVLEGLVKTWADR